MFIHHLNLVLLSPVTKGSQLTIYLQQVLFDHPIIYIYRNIPTYKALEDTA